MKDISKKIVFKLLFFTGFSTALLMTCFEILKQLIHSNITIWESHLTTIIFTTAVTVVLTYLALRKHDSVLRIISGIIPVCAWCRKVRDEEGNWVSFEEYIKKNSDARITHGICTECGDKFPVEEEYD